MVGKGQVNSRVIEEVARVYRRLDEQLDRADEAAGACDACGRCCDFDAYDHRLFVTTPELMHLAANLDGEMTGVMVSGRCPYNVQGKCVVYDYRFAGCRIFCCRGDANLQSELSESAITKFKSICTEFDIAYRYSDLPTALNGLAKP